jgi:hypothetical protein
MTPQFLTVDDVVKRWGGVVTRGTLANWRCKRVGPPFVKLRARVVYPMEGLLEWEAANQQVSNDCKHKEGDKCKK